MMGLMNDHDAIALLKVLEQYVTKKHIPLDLNEPEQLVRALFHYLAFASANN